MDLQDNQANFTGETEMTLLASASSFLGTLWFIGLIAVGSFAAGMVFKNAVLKIVTGGKHQP